MRSIFNGGSTPPPQGNVFPFGLGGTGGSPLLTQALTGVGSTGLPGGGLLQGSPQPQSFDLMRAFEGAATRGPSAESLSSQLLNQRMLIASQEVANRDANSSPPAGTQQQLQQQQQQQQQQHTDGGQGGVTIDTFDNLIGKSKIFQQHQGGLQNSMKN